MLSVLRQCYHQGICTISAIDCKQCLAAEMVKLQRVKLMWMHFCGCIQVGRLSKYLSSDCGFQIKCVRCNTTSMWGCTVPSCSRLYGMHGRSRQASFNSNSIKISWMSPSHSWYIWNNKLKWVLCRWITFAGIWIAANEPSQWTNHAQHKNTAIFTFWPMRNWDIVLTYTDVPCTSA